MRGDEEGLNLDRLRASWQERLDESAEPATMSPEERERCIAWLEEVLLSGILVSWLMEGKIVMRWDGIANEPRFDAR